jgi:hypothetical protein
MIDSTTIRAHKHAAGSIKGASRNALGKGCGGFTTKLHLMISDKFKFIKSVLSPGNCADISKASRLSRDAKCKSMIYDKGYDSDSFRKELSKNGIVPVIPGKINRITEIVYDKVKYIKRIYLSSNNNGRNQKLGTLPKLIVSFVTACHLF